MQIRWKSFARSVATWRVRGDRWKSLWNKDKPGTTPSWKSTLSRLRAPRWAFRITQQRGHPRRGGCTGGLGQRLRVKLAG